MRAAVHDAFGPPEVLQVRDMLPPVPGAGFVRVRVVAAAVNPKDAMVRSGKFKALSGSHFPKYTGLDFAGTVESLGPGVQGHVDAPGGAPGCKVGDAVYGMLDGWNGGACAEFVAAPVDGLAPLPPGLSFEQAACLPLAGLTALQALRDHGHIGPERPGRRVCIHGASGGVGTLAVQIAKALGAAQVTALCGAASAELVKSLGADEVLDYAAQPPATLKQRYHCFFDVFGNQSYAAVRKRLTPRGVYVTTVPNARNYADHARTRFWPGRRARLVIVQSRAADLRILSEWVRQGKLRPVVAATLPLEDIRRAHEMIQTKRTHGKIVIRIQDAPGQAGGPAGAAA